MAVAELVGMKVCITVSDPWGFGTEHVTGPFTAKVLQVGSNYWVSGEQALLLQLEPPLSYRAGSRAGYAAGFILPGPGKLKVLAKGEKFFAGFKTGYGHSVRQIGRFTEFSVNVPGRVPGSYTRWVKVLNEHGRTIRLYHDTFDPAQRFVHRSIKVPGPPRHMR